MYVQFSRVVFVHNKFLGRDEPAYVTDLRCRVCGHTVVQRGAAAAYLGHEGNCPLFP